MKHDRGPMKEKHKQKNMEIILTIVLIVVLVAAIIFIAGIKYLGPIISSNGIDELKGWKISPFKRDYILPTHQAILIFIDLLVTLAISPIYHKTSEFEKFLDWMGQP